MVSCDETSTVTCPGVPFPSPVSTNGQGFAKWEQLAVDCTVALMEKPEPEPNVERNTTAATDGVRIRYIR